MLGFRCAHITDYMTSVSWIVLEDIDYKHEVRTSGNRPIESTAPEIIKSGQQSPTLLQPPNNYHCSSTDPSPLTTTHKDLKQKAASGTILNIDF